MQFSSNKERTAILLGIGIVMAITTFAFFSTYNNNSISLDNAYKNIIEEKRILSQMRIHLLKSLEMEKNAVMALTDEESIDFASQSRASSLKVEQDLKDLRSIIDAMHWQNEKMLVDEFTNCWTEYGKLDQVILELTGENTNLKAARLSREKGAETMRKFELALEHIIQISTGTPNQGRINQLICHALIAGLKMFNLHSPHIIEANDEKMTQFEAEMKSEENEVLQSFDALGEIIGEKRQDAVFQAKTAFTEFLEVTAEVIKFSRINSNIKSLELSLGRKRKIAAQCDDILAAFQETVQNKTFKATR